MRVRLGKHGFQLVARRLPGNFQFAGGDIGRGAARDDAGELRFRRRQVERFGEDRRGRPWFGPQGIERQKSMHFLPRLMRRPVEGPNSHNDRQFVHAGNDDRLQSQGIKTGVVFQLIDGFFEVRPGVGIANEQPPLLNLDIGIENAIGRSAIAAPKMSVLSRLLYRNSK
jgi:hypothetical protein